MPSEQKVPGSGQQLEYDYYRFYVLISLLVLSGVMTIAATPVADRVPTWALLLSAILSVLGATTSFACQTELVRRATGHRAHPQITRYGMKILASLYLIAMAMFLFIMLELL